MVGPNLGCIRMWALLLCATGCSDATTAIATAGDEDESSAGSTGAGEDDDTGLQTSSGEPGDSGDTGEPPLLDPFADATVIAIEGIEKHDILGGTDFADYDDDGDRDLAISMRIPNPFIGDGSFLSIWSIDLLAGSATRLRRDELGFLIDPTMGHIEGDGMLDVVDVDSGVNGGEVTPIWLFEGGFEIGPSHAAPILPPVFDIDGDGRIEYLEDGGELLTIRGADGMGGWTLEQTIALDVADPEVGCSKRAAWTDFDADDDQDLAIAHACSDGTGRLTTYLHDGDAFSAHGGVDLDFAAQYLALGDVDGDAIPDAMLSASNGVAPLVGVAVLRGDGQGAFDETLVRADLESYGFYGTPADFDGDDVDEIYASTYGLPEGVALGYVYAQLRVVEGVLVPLPLPDGLAGIAGADLDGDGCDELVEFEGNAMRVLHRPCA